MNLYEMMFIINPDLEDDAVKSTIAAVKGMITGAGGEIKEERMMGKRRLAYRVKKKTDGIYMLIIFQVSATAIDELNHAMLINDQVLKHLITRAKHHAPPTE
jgi:small subunit ribosomal protein S6